MKRLLFAALALIAVLPLSAQDDRRDVRRGNRHFRKDDYGAAEVDYRKAVLKDSLSLKAQYNLASALYRREDYSSAAKSLAAVETQGELNADYHFNAGDIALAMEDYAAAVESFKRSLILDPSDLEAKENYIYAKKMLQNSQDQSPNENPGGSGNDGDDDSRNNENSQDNNGQNSGDSDRNQDSGDSGQQPEAEQDGNSGQAPGISRQQASQMLRAIQAKESETQEKVNREKALLLKSNQKEKNW